MIPKCTSWLGHKFEGRYSTTPPPENILAGLEGNAPIVVNELLKTMSAKTYERDICVRCGVTVELAISNERAMPPVELDPVLNAERN